QAEQRRVGNKRHQTKKVRVPFLEPVRFVLEPTHNRKHDHADGPGKLLNRKEEQSICKRVLAKLAASVTPSDQNIVALSCNGIKEGVSNVIPSKTQEDFGD